MSQASAPAAKPKVRRLWFPITVVILFGAAIAAVLFAGDSFGLDLGQQRFGAMAATVLGLLLITAWLILFSGVNWGVRAAWLLVLVALAASLRIDFDGDMKPKFGIRWYDPDAGRLETQRAGQKKLEGALNLGLASPMDVPAFRGLARDGILPSPTLPSDWKTHPPKELWKQPSGGGYAGYVGVGPVVFTIEQRGGQEATVCYDAATGTERWKYLHDALFTETLGGPGPRATPTYADGKLYTLGATGHLACLDANNGTKLWAKDILAGNGNIQWGMSGSPLVIDDLVIVNPGAQKPEFKGKAVVAYQRHTGEVAWSAGDTQAGYSSPQLSIVAGVPQVLVFDGEGLGSYEPKTGRKLWWHAYPTYQGINVAQPLVFEGDKVLVSAGYGVGSALLQLSQAGDQWTVKEVWKNRNLQSKFCSPVLFEGHFYGLDDGILSCVEAKTGKRTWKGGRYGHGQILLVNNLIFVLAETGDIVLVAAQPDKHNELGKVKVFDDHKTWNTPLVLDGKAYVRNAHEMAAFDLRSVAGEASATKPAAPKPTPSASKN